MSTAWSSSDRRRRLPPGWSSSIVPRILDRDGHRCTWIDERGNRCPARATEVDHVKAGDDHRDANLRSLCGPHHRRKTQAESAAARWRFVAQRPAVRHPGLRP